MLNEKQLEIAQQVQRKMEREENARLPEDPCKSCPVGGGCINVVCPKRKEWERETDFV